MPYPVSTFKQASTMSIYNTIRANAPLDIQQNMPELTSLKDFPSVGENIVGYPTVMNYFCSELVNRIAAVYLKSLTFNNPYRMLKKGFLDFGEVVEEIWRGIAKVQVYNPELAYKREFQRNPPDIRTTFHVINWRVQYPLTVSREMLRTAFTSSAAMENFINEVIQSVYQANEYDEFLLFKYMLIKAASHGKMAPVNGDYSSDIDNAAIDFKTVENQIIFPSDTYNEAKVLNSTPRDKQLIFMDAKFNAMFDVKVLAQAFNMEKADFLGRLVLIDNFTKFDNARFAEILEDSTYLEEVTDEELAAMSDVKAMVIDEDWFQVYDQLFEFTNNYLGSSMEWQYWLHSHKIVSHSPYHNAVVFLDTNTAPTAPEELVGVIVNKSISPLGTVFGIQFDTEGATWVDSVQLVQTETEATNLIAIDSDGLVTMPTGATTATLHANCYGKIYEATSAITPATDVGDHITFGQMLASGAPAEEDTVDGKTYNQITVSQLKTYATENNIDISGLTKKIDIWNAIVTAESD